MSACSKTVAAPARDSLVDVNVLLAHQRGPFLDLAVDPARQRLGTAAAGVEAEFSKALLHVGCRKDFVHAAVELGNDRRRRAGRRKQAEPDRIEAKLWKTRLR